MSYAPNIGPGKFLNNPNNLLKHFTQSKKRNKLSSFAACTQIRSLRFSSLYLLKAFDNIYLSYIESINKIEINTKDGQDLHFYGYPAYVPGRIPDIWPVTE